MTLDEFKHIGLHEELAKISSGGGYYRRWLDGIKFPKGNIPQFDVPAEFWDNVLAAIDNGVSERKLCDLIVQVLATHPGNEKFKSAREDYCHHSGRLDSPFRVLFFSATPLSLGRLQVDRELRAVLDRVAAAPARDGIELRSYPATRSSDLTQQIVNFDPHMIHFSGHGDAMARLEFDDKAVDGESFAELLGKIAAGKRVLRATLLNACWSANVARRLEQERIRAFGWHSAVPDAAAITFAEQFYTVLASRYDYSYETLKDAAQIAIAQTRTSGGALPTLYLGAS